MDIQEAHAGVDHQHPESHHLSSNVAAKIFLGRPGSNPIDLDQDLTPEVGAPSYNPVQYSARPSGRKVGVCPPIGGTLI